MFCWSHLGEFRLLSVGLLFRLWGWSVWSLWAEFSILYYLLVCNHAKSHVRHIPPCSVMFYGVLCSMWGVQVKCIICLITPSDFIRTAWKLGAGSHRQEPCWDLALSTLGTSWTEAQWQDCHFQFQPRPSSRMDSCINSSIVTPHLHV